MKQISQATTISLFLLLIISRTSAHLLSLHQLGDTPENKINGISLQEEDDFPSLMGLEECGDEDEACKKRRMVVEAHLDYIYTQHQNP
ncbi:hypothetical protein CDL12_17460 [Handroanthus impetiginosus]|uniref:Phytosulfokine n=1 Tax=Handroanthus impetiginosus TaxID=429701 RepID=A0A2G9GXF1_9LAMI|nr:hypothetical protein CDL12_17460 [Handroanthus impetiginosus]